MAALADTLSLNKMLIYEMRRDYGYTDGLAPDMEWPQDTVAHSSNRHFSDGSNVFGDMFEWLGQIPPVVWYVLLALVLVIVLVLVLRNVSWRRKKEEAPDDDDQPVDIYAVDQPQEELERAVAAHDWDQALRMTYILTLRHLHEAGRIEWLPSRTPMFFVRQVGMAPFLHLTNAFLRVRFGKYPATEEEWRQAEEWRAVVEKGGEG